MVANALIRKEPRVIYHLKFMGLIVILGIFEQIRDVQAKGSKEDHLKSEVMVKQQVHLVEDSWGLKTFRGRL